MTDSTTTPATGPDGRDPEIDDGPQTSPAEPDTAQPLEDVQNETEEDGPRDVGVPEDGAGEHDSVEGDAEPAVSPTDRAVDEPGADRPEPVEPDAAQPEVESAESESAETEPAETESEQEAAEAEPAEPEVAGSEVAGSEATEAASAESEGTETAPVADTAPVDTVPVDAEPAVAEPADAEPADAEPADAEPVPPSATTVIEPSGEEAGDEPGDESGDEADREAAPHHARHRADTAQTPRVTEPAVAPAPSIPSEPAQAGRASTGPRHESHKRRLTGALAPRSTRGQLLAAVLCAVLGFAMVAQARQTNADGLASLRQSELVEILSGLNEQSTRLENEIRDLQDTRDKLRSGSDSVAAAQKAAQERLDVLGILTGTVPASGPGIQLLISDPDRAVAADELLNAVQELRGAGAEAIQIGDVRVVAQTALVEGRDGVVVDGNSLLPPYKILAVGDPQALFTALSIPGGVLEVLRNEGAKGTVRRLDDVRIDALRALDDAQYARPAPTKE